MIWEKIKRFILAILGIGIVSAAGGQLNPMSASNVALKYNASEIRNEYVLEDNQLKIREDIIIGEKKGNMSPKLEAKGITFLPDGTFSKVDFKGNKIEFEKTGGKEKVRMYKISDECKQGIVEACNYRYEQDIVLNEYNNQNKWEIALGGEYTAKNAGNKYELYQKSMFEEPDTGLDPDFEKTPDILIEPIVIFDANGVTTTASTTIANDKLVIEVNDEWLEKAEYPVVVDPTYVIYSSVYQYHGRYSHQHKTVRDDDGTLWAIVRTGASTTRLASSTDDGANWSSEDLGVGATSNYSSQASITILSNGNPYMCFVGYYTGYTTYQQVGCREWNSSSGLQTITWLTANNSYPAGYYPAVEAMSDGKRFVTYYDGGYDVWVNTYDSGWGTDLLMSTTTNQYYPTILVNGTSAYVYHYGFSSDDTDTQRIYEAIYNGSWASSTSLFYESTHKSTEPVLIHDSAGTIYLTYLRLNDSTSDRSLSYAINDGSWSATTTFRAESTRSVYSSSMGIKGNNPLIAYFAQAEDSEGTPTTTLSAFVDKLDVGSGVWENQMRTWTPANQAYPHLAWCNLCNNPDDFMYTVNNWYTSPTYRLDFYSDTGFKEINNNFSLCATGTDCFAWWGYSTTATSVIPAVATTSWATSVEATSTQYDSLKHYDRDYMNTTIGSIAIYNYYPVYHMYEMQITVDPRLLRSFTWKLMTYSEQYSTTSPTTTNAINAYSWVYNASTSENVIMESALGDTCQENYCDLTHTTTTDITDFFYVCDTDKWCTRFGTAATEVASDCRQHGTPGALTNIVCGKDTYATTNAGVYQTIGCEPQENTEDLNNECTETAGTCWKDNCNGWTGNNPDFPYSCDIYADGLQHNCGTCQKCDTFPNATSGCADVTASYYDTPSPATYGCTGSCESCTGGTCETTSCEGQSCGCGFSEICVSGTCTPETPPDCNAACGGPAHCVVPSSCSWYGGTSDGESTDCLSPRACCCL